MSARVRQVIIALRAVATLDILAVAAVVAPWPWLAWSARQSGFDVLQANPLVHYLTRSTSAMYALHGALLWFLSTDIRRYAPVARFLAWMAFPHAMALIAIDLSVGMPTAWSIAEVGGYLSESLLLLFLLNRAEL